jgi:hypothetical protein
MKKFPAASRESAKPASEIGVGNFTGRKISRSRTHSSKSELELSLQPRHGALGGRNAKRKSLVGIVSVVRKIFLPTKSSCLYSGDILIGKQTVASKRCLILRQHRFCCSAGKREIASVRRRVAFCPRSTPLMRCRIVTRFFPLLISLPALGAEVRLPAQVEFNRDVRPILSDNCFCLSRSRCVAPQRQTAARSARRGARA